MNPSDLAVPTDEWAERAVTACAVATRRGCDLARARVRPGDMWDPKLRRIYQAALTLEPLLDQEERVRAVALASESSMDELTQLIEDRPVEWDTNGGFARRVIDAARRRALMEVCAHTYNALGTGSRLEDIEEMVGELQRAIAW